MKVSKEKVAEHEKRILAAAAQLFRKHGFNDVTVSQIMKEAGLTHGAFYGHFSNKEALIAEAVGQALPPAPNEAVPRRSASNFADSYLSEKHRDERANSCLFSSLGTEASRGSPDLRHRMTEGIRRRLSHLETDAIGETADEKRRAAILTWSAMVGAMVLARLVDDDHLSKELMIETRRALPIAP